MLDEFEEHKIAKFELQTSKIQLEFQISNERYIDKLRNYIDTEIEKQFHTNY